jgi:hypothetical protein
MTQTTHNRVDHSAGEILPSQYNDLVRRRSGGFEAEQRLLWAVLENAIHIYRSNMGCVTAKQRYEFEEICRWFRPSKGQPGRLFSFETICDLLEIDAGQLLQGLESSRIKGTSAKKRASELPRSALRLRRLAA